MSDLDCLSTNTPDKYEYFQQFFIISIQTRNATGQCNSKKCSQTVYFRYQTSFYHGDILVYRHGFAQDPAFPESPCLCLLFEREEEKCAADKKRSVNNQCDGFGRKNQGKKGMIYENKPTVY